MAQTAIMTLRQVATRLQVSDREVLDLMSAGVIKGQKAGAQWRFRTEEIEAYANSLAAAPAARDEQQGQASQGD